MNGKNRTNISSIFRCFRRSDVYYLDPHCITIPDKERQQFPVKPNTAAETQSALGKSKVKALPVYEHSLFQGLP